MKKIIIKKKAVVAPAEPVKVQFIPAIEMEEGVEYLGTMGNTILKLLKIHDAPDAIGLSGPRALLKIPVEIMAEHINGGEKYLCRYTGLSPVMIAPPEELMYIRRQIEIYNSKMQSYRTTAAPVKTKVVVNADGTKEVVKVEKKARGNVDPRTGYGTGTQGHMVGTIMLDNKCSPTNRALCVSKIHATLVKDYGFEDKKAKALAQSWYSTLWTRKPEIYQKGR